MKIHLEKDQKIANRVYESFLAALDESEKEQLEKILMKIKRGFEK